MILWDRIRKNLDDGVEKIVRVSKVVSERTRLEAAVARRLVDKGSLETKAERAYKRLGERVFFLWEQKSHGIMKDQEVLEALKEVSDLRCEIESVKLSIRKISLGEGED